MSDFILELPTSRQILLTDNMDCTPLRQVLSVIFLWAVSCSAATTYVCVRGEFHQLLVMLQNRRVDSGNDPVVWHSFGVTHIVRTEDFPVMPVEHVRLGTLLSASASQLQNVAHMCAHCRHITDRGCTA